MLNVLTGVSAGMTEALIVASPDLVKIRLQDKRNVGILLFCLGFFVVRVVDDLRVWFLILLSF